MNVIAITLLISIFLGVVGAWVRIIIQWMRDGIQPGGQEWEFGLLLETFIGAVCGGVSWLVYLTTETAPTQILVPILYLACLALGLAGTDSLENLLKKWIPSG